MTTGRFLPRVPAAWGNRVITTSPRFRFMAGTGRGVPPPPPPGDPSPHPSTDCRRRRACQRRRLEPAHTPVHYPASARPRLLQEPFSGRRSTRTWLPPGREGVSLPPPPL